MLRSVSLFFSYLLHPLWMPLIIFMISLRVDPYFLPDRQFAPLLFQILIVNIVAPTISIWLMIRKKMVSDAELSNRTERAGPYLIVIAYYLITFFFLRTRANLLTETVLAMILSVSVSLILCLLINFRWKISVHSMTQGGLIGTLSALSILHFLNIGPLILTLLFLSGWVAFSRVYLGAHTHRQVYAGFVLGFLVSYVMIRYGVQF